MEKVTLYTWPDSQECMDCVNGIIVNSTTSFGDNIAICSIASENNIDGACKDKNC